MDLAAFVLGLLGLIIAALSLGWQLITWLLGGRRVKAVLMYGNQAAGGVLTGPVKSDGTVINMLAAKVPGGIGPEVLGIKLTNQSRTSKVLVTSVAAKTDLGLGFDPQATVIGDHLPLWLEAGESNSWYLPAATARALVTTARGIGQPSTFVWMTASLGRDVTVSTKAKLLVP